MKFAFLTFLIASACSATTIDFASSTSTPNNTSGATVLATVDPSWASPLSSPIPSYWITAAGDATPWVGTNVTYTFNFVLPTGFTNAILNLGVFADDSATVKIDNTTLFNEITTLGTHCASGAIGCTTANEGIITNLNVTPDLHAGANTITFQDFQEVGGTPFGLDFDGSLSYNTTAVPEPKAILLLCAGLVGLGLLKAFQRKRAAVRA